MLIDPLGTDDGDVVAFFASSPFTALLQQRGVATLHAAAVATEAGAVMLLGRSGIGKSSLAAALVERGYPLLADDVTGVMLDAGGRPVALPAFAHQRLWGHPGRDALARAGAVEGAAEVGEVLGAVATGLRRAAACVRRLRAGSQPLPGHRHRARVARQRLLVAVEKHPPPAGDERDGTTPRAFPRRHRDGAASAGGADDEATVSVLAGRAGGPRRGAPARTRGRRPRTKTPYPVHEETSTSSALTHHHTLGESHQPATRSG